MPVPVGPGSMLARQYISQKPDKARAQFYNKPNESQNQKITQNRWLMSEGKKTLSPKH